MSVSGGNKLQTIINEDYNMNTKLLWYQISCDTPNSFEKFLYSFRLLSKQITEKFGHNAIYFPSKSFPNDYSEVFISISQSEEMLFKDLLTLYKATSTKEDPVNKIDINNPVYSDKIVFSSEDEEAHFL